jgi:hypothetical protein
MNLKLSLTLAVVGGVCMSAAAGSLFAGAAAAKPAAGATRLDPIAVVPVTVKPAVAATVEALPVALPAAAVSSSLRPTRPPIVSTRSPGRPAPVVTIPR